MLIILICLKFIFVLIKMLQTTVYTTTAVMKFKIINTNKLEIMVPQKVLKYYENCMVFVK